MSSKSGGGLSDGESMDIAQEGNGSQGGSGRREGGKGGKTGRTGNSMGGKRAFEEDEASTPDIRRKITREEFKILFKFKEGNDIKAVSPVVLTSALRKAIGDIELAKVLWDGCLLVKGVNQEQKNKAMKLQSICKKSIAEKRIVGEQRFVGSVCF